MYLFRDKLLIWLISDFCRNKGHLYEISAIYKRTNHTTKNDVIESAFNYPPEKKNRLSSA